MTVAINSQTASVTDRYLQVSAGTYSIAASGSMSSRALQSDYQSANYQSRSERIDESPPGWLDEAIGLIHHLAEQSRSGSLDCDCVTPGIENGSVHLLASLSRGQISHPYIYATRRGTIQFEWESGSAYFEIEVVGERAGEWLFSDPSAGEELSGDLFEEESLNQVLRHISRCAGNSR